MDMKEKKLIFLDEISFVQDVSLGNEKEKIQQFIEEIKTKDEENYQYPKYICKQEKINAPYNQIDFKSPVYFFTYKSIENAINKIEKTVSKYNKALEQIQKQEENDKQKQIVLEEQKIYMELYLEQQVQIPQLNFFIKEHQIKGQILEEEIKTLKQNQVQNSKLDCNCYQKDNRIYELQTQCQELRTKQLQEIELNKQKDQKILELSTLMDNLKAIHQQEINTLQQQEKYKYLERLSNQEQQICQFCKKSEASLISWNQKYDKLNNEYQTFKENAQLQINNKQSQINNLQSQFCKLNSQQCKCKEKDSQIDVLLIENQNLKKQVVDIERRSYKYKQSFDDNSVDLEKSKQRYENLYKINQQNLENLREINKQNQDLKVYLEDTRKRTLQNSQQILNYEYQFQKALQEKIEIEKGLSQQLKQFDLNSKDTTIQQLKQCIQNQQKNYDKLFEENKKFKETYRDVITQITQHTARQSIIRASQQNSQN